MGWLRVSCEGSDDNTCCTPPDCSCDNPVGTSLPVACSAYTEYQTHAGCNTGDCAAFDVIVSATFLSFWGCPWCEDTCCAGELCEGELDDCTGTYELGSGCGGECWACFDDGAFILQPQAQCCPPETGGSGYSANIARVGATPPDVHQSAPDTLFNAFSITYSAANAGADVLDDLCEVYAGVYGGSFSPPVYPYLYVDYVYNDGSCNQYRWDIGGTISTAYAAGDYIDCINAQTTGSSAADLGLTATGTATLLLTISSLSAPVYPRTKIDTGASVPVYAYKPNVVWFTWDSYVDFDPCTCHSCDGNDLETGFEATSDTMQRVNTTQAWAGTANCPYNYTWSITDMDDRLLSASISMEDT